MPAAQQSMMAERAVHDIASDHSPTRYKNSNSNKNKLKTFFVVQFLRVFQFFPGKLKLQKPSLPLRRQLPPLLTMSMSIAIPHPLSKIKKETNKYIVRKHFFVACFYMFCVIFFNMFEAGG
tara:strand:- start:164 stop:526 length:363 start_codon:yes stop_codon:yes gene_type:complete